MPPSAIIGIFFFLAILLTSDIAFNCGKIGDGFIILSEILVELYYKNFKIGETSSKFINRVRGESSVNSREIFNSFLGLIRIYNLKNKIKKKF